MFTVGSCRLGQTQKTNCSRSGSYTLGDNEARTRQVTSKVSIRVTVHVITSTRVLTHQQRRDCAAFQHTARVGATLVTLTSHNTHSLTTLSFTCSLRCRADCTTAGLVVSLISAISSCATMLCEPARLNTSRALEPQQLHVCTPVCDPRSACSCKLQRRVGCCTISPFSSPLFAMFIDLIRTTQFQC